MAKRKVWTESDTKFLIDNVNMSLNQLAIELQTTTQNVWTHRKKLGLTRERFKGCELTCPDYCPYSDCLRPTLQCANDSALLIFED